uniref:Cytochrome b5 heme-binding domain-containing protein n=1 Tax=Moschus moschiferus TaxID=68415 RepID=A0A8C6FEN7_MOSMO
QGRANEQEGNAKFDLPRKSLHTYIWQEVQRHNQETDQWLVINRKVYDVTGWVDRHPGGRQVLNYYAGEDATDVFRAMHPDPDIVLLYLKPLLIGELAPEEPNQERNKNSQLVEDFQELRRTLETMNMFNANLGFFFLHFAQVLILEALAWVIVWHFGSGWLITIFISFLLVVAQVQGAILQHDLGHLSIFKKSKWNRLMQKVVMGHFEGLSAKWWNNRHFQHHVKTNIYPKDPDIDVGPLFVIGELQPVKVCLEILSTREIFQEVALRKVYTLDIAWASSFYIRYFITFGPFYGIFGTMVLLESPWVAYITQMSHIPMKMSKEENQDWFSTQVLATCNVEQSLFNDWFTGHLNFQIEHHLFPTMPCHNYHKVAPLVKSLCAKHGLQYVNKPILKAFGDILRALTCFRT